MFGLNDVGSGRRAFSLLCVGLLFSVAVDCRFVWADSAQPPEITGLFQSADRGDAKAFVAVASPTVGYLGLKFQEAMMTPGKITVLIGDVTLEPIDVDPTGGTSPRITLKDLSGVRAGTQAITAVWAPTVTPAVEPSAATKPFAIEIRKVGVQPAPKPIVTWVLSPSDPAVTPPKVIRTNVSKANIDVKFGETTMVKGVLRITFGAGDPMNVAVSAGDSNPKRVPLDLSNVAMKEDQVLTVIWDPDGNGDGQLPSPPSDPVSVNIDTVPPKVSGFKLTRGSDGYTTVAVQFEDNDFSTAPSTDAGSPLRVDNYQLSRTGGKSGIESTDSLPTMSLSRDPDSDTVLVRLGPMIVDNYRLTVKNVQDSHGNTISPDTKYDFSRLPDPEPAPHVAFPEYTVRQKRKPDTEFNPGDRVETRVARLYYFRNAHRAAEIVNRNIKHYNSVAVTKAQTDAEDARNVANAKAADRKQKEASAIRSAEMSRGAERSLASSRQLLEQQRVASTQAATAVKQAAETLDTANKKVDQDNKAVSDAAGDADKTAAATKLLDADKATQATAQTNFNNATTRAASAQQAVTDLLTRVSDAETQVATLRSTERDKQESVSTAQESEDRARENQFRAEVALATTDPNTYVPGDVASQDPVTQVSVSVIGEGVIQLRGPIRGINKIRTMINQIDSPVGQVKVGIFTVQVNGEHGDRMERVATRIEGNIDLSRYLTNQSLGLLRRSVQEIAGEVVKTVDAAGGRGNRQLDRDRRYLYAFFGRDFIDELYEMDSEFLRTENKILSLHSMDTTSQSQAFFIMALAKNDVRQMILERFRYLIQCEMPCLEWDFRRTANMTKRSQHYKINSLEEVTKAVNAKYHFSNLHAFFNALVDDSDAMTPLQREFIRLAQIFKSQMVAEMEYKQRVIERGLIEDQANDEDSINSLAKPVQDRAQKLFIDSLDNVVALQEQVEQLIGGVVATAMTIDAYTAELSRDESVLATYRATTSTIRAQFTPASDDKSAMTIQTYAGLQSGSIVNGDVLKAYSVIYAGFLSHKDTSLTPEAQAAVQTIKTYYGSIVSRWLQHKEWYPQSFADRLDGVLKSLDENASPTKVVTYNQAVEYANTTAIIVGGAQVGREKFVDIVRRYSLMAKEMNSDIKPLLDAFAKSKWTLEEIRLRLTSLEESVKSRYLGGDANVPIYLRKIQATSELVLASLSNSEGRISRSRAIAKRLRRDVDHRKLLEFLTDEQEEKYIELEEGFRSHISQIDNYLKRLAIALEDDFKCQFYDPAFAEVRRASREWDVNLGQIERTTILTNNRAFAKVSPQATMEFDLPKRDIMITEAMGGAKAIVNEYGNLLQDPTFLSVAGMLSGSPPVTGVAAQGAVAGLPGQGIGAPAVKNILPGQSTDSAEQLMTQTGGPSRKFGSEFEKLIPDPAVYKIETGTGFEIRPVIQPDGHSIIYDFDYMYTTNVREPVRPDEKHLGRVKRHFIHTEVQTSSFELREISRYQVALKVSRTSRGVPLMEDIPGVGLLFRPLPSAESSLQQNIILGQSTVYPTLFDLMGLRWSKYVVDLNHAGLRDTEHVVRGRNTAIHDFTFDEASARVDDFLDIDTKAPQLLRRDLYRQQRTPSPYHPGGYHSPQISDEQDPTGHDFNRPDTRPEDYREPPYDSRYGGPVDQAPTRGRSEVIEVAPPSRSQQRLVPPNMGFSIPSRESAPEPVTIRPMKFERPAQTPQASTKVPKQGFNTKLDQHKPPATQTSSKPKFINLPSIGTRKK